MSHKLHNPPGGLLQLQHISVFSLGRWTHFQRTELQSPVAVVSWVYVGLRGTPGNKQYIVIPEPHVAPIDT